MQRVITQKEKLTLVGALVLLSIFSFAPIPHASVVAEPVSQEIVVSGNYTCLPTKPNVPYDDTCVFGLHSEDGLYYAVDIGASADAMERFRAGAFVTVGGIFVPREALSSSHWSAYTLQGVIRVVNTY